MISMQKPDPSPLDPVHPCQVPTGRTITNPQNLSQQVAEIRLHSGITMRDHFAAMAMQALVASKALCNHADERETLAQLSYRIADAMLTVRQEFFKEATKGGG